MTIEYDEKGKFYTEVVTKKPVSVIIFVQTGVTTEGKVLGEVSATGIRPNFTPRLEAAGFKLGADVFRPSAAVQNARR